MSEAVCRSRLINEVRMKADESCKALGELQARLGKPQDARLSWALAAVQVSGSISSDSTSSEVSEHHTEQCAVGHKLLDMQDTHTKRSTAEDLAMSDSKRLSHILIQMTKKSKVLKKCFAESFVSTNNCSHLEKMLKHGTLWSSENAMLTLHLKLRGCSAEEQTQLCMKHCIEIPACLLFIRHWLHLKGLQVF